MQIKFYVALLVLILSGICLAQDSGVGKPLDVLEGRPDAPPGDTDQSIELGSAFEGSAAGITFRPPAGSKEIRRAGVPDEIIQYLHEAREWTLKASRFTLESKIPLTTWNNDAGKSQDGVLENTVKALQKTHPGAEVVRQDIVNAGESAVGLIAMRFTIGTSDRLLQQAIVQESELVYYVLEFSSPGAKVGTSMEEDFPPERQAVEMFMAVLDTVRLVDRTAIRQDQDERLYRTRALYVNISEKRLREVLVPEQWFRLIRDGKDIGYSYVIEEDKRADGSPGVNVGVRARSMPEPGVQVDAESWLFMSFNRKNEDFSNVALFQSGNNPRTYTSEFGSSINRLKPVAEDGLGGLANKGVKLNEEYKLDVTFFGKSANAPPLLIDLPPFYLPQAMGHLLPRLFPLNTPKSYLFATYVSDFKRVMLRYVDVEPPVNVTLDGESVLAVPIKDRIGLEGSITIHYMSHDGKYLGSVNEQTKVKVLPTDAETLKKLWKDVNLTRPEVHQPLPKQKK